MNKELLIDTIENFTNVDRLIKDNDSDFYVPTNAFNKLTGIFDIMMRTATKNLDAQFKSGRIRQENYASAYIQIYIATLQAAMQFMLQADIAKEQMLTYERQRKGYDEDYMIKTFNGIYDHYIAFLTSMPNIDNQPYPSAFTQFYEANGNYENDQNNDVDMPRKTTLLDSLAGKLMQRIHEYQPTEPTKTGGGSDTTDNGMDYTGITPNPKPKN